MSGPLCTQHGPRLTSLGLVVIDTIKFGNGTVVNDVLGGSGAYCSLGARLFATDDPQSIALKIHAGHDLPSSIESKMREWLIDLTIQKKTEWKSVRGLLEYADTTFGPKSFRYTTPVLQIEPKDLQHTPALEASAFHFLCHPDKVEHLVNDLLRHRGSMERPMVVWEPAPPTCTFENFQSCLQAVRNVDIFSPNHLELLRLCNKDDQTFSRSLIEGCALLFFEAGIGPHKNGILLVRAGEHGCMIQTRTERPAIWLPPYYEAEELDRIVDTTGAGNAFLGGFIIGYHNTKNEFEAACYGTVAASFMLEQIGTPSLTRSEDGTALWNNGNPLVRLKEFRWRCGLR